jgi:hypothetical protein
MIKLLQQIWERLSVIIFPDDYYSWQTLIYLGFFSFAMSWVALLLVDRGWTVNIIATSGWLFFGLGIGWLLEERQVQVYGMPLAPWVMGAIFCTFSFGTFGGRWSTALMIWPLVSVAIAVIPQFLDWKLRPTLPSSDVRQQLILLTLIGLLLSNWFQFYFRLQDWFTDYPSLLADDFGRSGFVFRMSLAPREQAQGVTLLTVAQTKVEESLDGTPWPFIERWLKNLDEQVVRLEQNVLSEVDLSEERDMWRLQARPRTTDDDGYALDLMAVWSGPASMETGYYHEKTCLIQPQFPPEVETDGDNLPQQVTPLAEVTCELATPKRPGRPPITTL